MYIIPELRGRGIGKVLMLEVLRMARAGGLDRGAPRGVTL